MLFESWDSLHTFSMSSSVLSSGERPPWTQRNWSLTTAARGRLSKHSMTTSYTSSEYFVWPVWKLLDLKNSMCLYTPYTLVWMWNNQSNDGIHGYHAAKRTYQDTTAYVPRDKVHTTARNGWDDGDLIQCLVYILQLRNSLCPHNRPRRDIECLQDHHLLQTTLKDHSTVRAHHRKW